jgi:hypothetical protein
MIKGQYNIGANMMKLSKTLLSWALILFACSPGISSPQVLPASPSTHTPTPETDAVATFEFPTSVATQQSIGPKIIVTVGTPHIGQGPDGNFPTTDPLSDTCAFVWANPLLEELTAIFDTEVKKLNFEASAHASAFGEDCVYPNGKIVFFAMETDFYIILPVSDLTDFVSFGNWIAKTMPVVNSLPKDMIEGPNSGFVEYTFENSENDILIVRIPINEYKEKVNGITGEDLFLLFYKE